MGAIPIPVGLDSGFEGDEYCLLPPAPDEGLQIHLGPGDYRDPEALADYLVGPDEELRRSLVAPIAVNDRRFWHRIRVQMRPGVVNWMAGVVQNSPGDGVHLGAACADATVVGALAAGGNLVFDSPPEGTPAPENEGLGQVIDSDSLCLMLHSHNFGGRAPHLNEAWINLYFLKESEVTQVPGTVALVGGGITLPAQQSTELTRSTRALGSGRITSLFGDHGYGRLERLAVRLNDALVYDSWDPAPSTFNYDSVTLNPVPGNGTSGAVSGILSFKRGDRLEYSCFITNHTNDPLTVGTRVGDGEVCNLWGYTVGASFE